MGWTKTKLAAVLGAALLICAGILVIQQRFRALVAADRQAVLASVDSLVNALARGDADAFAAGLYVRNDAERRLAESAGLAAKGMADLSAALVERFGDTKEIWAIRYTFCIVSCVPLFGYEGIQPQIDIHEDDAWFRVPHYTDPKAPGFPLHFVRTNGQWKLVMDEKPASERAAEIGVPGNESWARQHHEFAREIRAGRHPSPLEAWLALTKQHGWKGYTNLPQPSPTRPR